MRARAGGVLLRPDGGLQSINSNAQTEWAVAEVTVDGRDVANLALALQPGRLMRGRLVADYRDPRSGGFGRAAGAASGASGSGSTMLACG